MARRTFLKVLTAADRSDRISVPARLRDGLFPDVAENSKTHVRMVDEKGDSYGMILKVRNNKTKPEFMSKGCTEFVKKRKLLPGDVLFFSEGHSPGHINVRVQETGPKLQLAPPGSPVGRGHAPLEPLTAPPMALGDRLLIGSDHGPVEPAPVALGLNLSIGSDLAPNEPAPVALGLSLSIGSGEAPLEPPPTASVAMRLNLPTGSDQAPSEPPLSVPLELELGLFVASFPSGETLGSTKAEMQEKRPTLQLAMGQPSAFPQDQPTVEHAAALGLSLASNAIPPPITVHGPQANLSFSAKAGAPELLKPESKPPETALFLGPPAAHTEAAFFAAVGFLAKAGSDEILEPKSPTAFVLPSPEWRPARQYFSAVRSHGPLKPKPRRSTALIPGSARAPVARLAEKHAAGLYFSAARLDEVPVATVSQELVVPQVAHGAALSSFSTTFGMLKKPQQPAEIVEGPGFLTGSGHLPPEPTPPAAVSDQTAARRMG